MADSAMSEPSRTAVEWYRMSVFVAASGSTWVPLSGRAQTRVPGAAAGSGDGGM